MKRVVGVVVGALVALGVVTTPASATVLVSGSLNTVEFVNFENLFTPTLVEDGDGGLELIYVRKAEGSLPEIGDVLVGIINANNLTVGGITTSFDDLGFQLTGIFAQEISAASFLEDPDLDGAGGDKGTLHLDLTPTTVATGATLFCNSAAMTDCFSTSLAAGEEFAFYLQTGLGTTIFESNGTMLDDVTKATDGAVFLTLGPAVTAGDVGPGVVYSHVDFNFLTTQFPVDNFGGLNIITNGTGLSFIGIPGGIIIVDPDGLLGTNHVLFDPSIVLNPNRLAPPLGVSSPWFFRSDDPAYLLPFNNVIPEVSSLWMLGMGLSGFGIFRRRKWLG